MVFNSAAHDNFFNCIEKYLVPLVDTQLPWKSVEEGVNLDAGIDRQLAGNTHRRGNSFECSPALDLVREEPLLI